MIGYQRDFLGEGFELPLPEYTDRLETFVLSKPGLTENIQADYPNFSVVTNSTKRTPIFAALNIDQEKVLNTTTVRSSSWRIDFRIGSEFQLNNEYYKDPDPPRVKNLYDKGHLAARDSTAWGDTAEEAQEAANKTFSYANSVLQHRELNEDEWRSLEEWVLEIPEVKGRKVTSFSGPIHGAFPRTVTPPGMATAEIPAGFFKVICFAGTDEQLHVRAFMMLQDEGALVELTGRAPFHLQKYQVTVTEIEELTGLKFPEIVRAQNPLLFYDSVENNAVKEQLNITSFPERIEVNSPEEIQDESPRPDLFEDDTINVFIAAAMPNPVGTDRGNEWVSVINLSNDEVDLTDWWISDTNNSRKIGELVPAEANRKLRPGSAAAIPLKGGSGGLRLVNTGGAIALFGPSFDDLDLRGHRIDRVSYTAKQVKEGRPIVFTSRPIESDPE